MKRTLVLLLAALMLLSLCGCNSKEKEEVAYERGEVPENCVWDLEGTIFPLKEPVTFTIVTQGARTKNIEDIENNKDWKSLCEATNINFEFVSLGNYDSPEARDALQIRLMGEDYGDAIWSFYVDTLTIDDINELGSAGIAIPLNEYMENPTYMPNFNKEILNKGNLYNNMKSEDGNCYSFCGVSEIAAYTAGEGLMQVNTAWLDSWKQARNLDHSPQTLSEFEDMLEYFNNEDLNGNGLKDEIPYFIAQGAFAGCCTLEHAMGMFGIATKDSAADMDIQIDDNGKCEFVYTTDTYKQALNKFAEWYSKGYVWEDIFTGNTETINDVMGNAQAKIGLYNACENINGFEPILPPTIDGYKARYHMHPSVRLGTRQPEIVITNKCEHPEILAAFFDLFYNFDNNILFNYGTISFDNNWITTIDEKYHFNNINRNDGQDSVEDCCLKQFIFIFEIDTLNNFNNKIDTESYFGNQQRVKGYQLYEENELWNPTGNLWPRCSILSEYAEDYAFKYTDVSSIVAEYRAKFVTGQLDIDTNWDQFQEKIKKLGVDDMRTIIQNTYNKYVNK